MSPLSRRSLRRGITIAVIAAAIVVIVLVGLIAGGVLVLASNNSGTVTISYVHLVIQEGNTTNGPWFGRWSINYTEAEGFPIQVPSGGNFSIVWLSIINLDGISHTIYSVKVSPAPPLKFAYTMPKLPLTIPGDAEGGTLGIYIGVPSNPGATYAVTVFVNALSPAG